MTDFGPCRVNLKTLLLWAAAPVGVYGTFFGTILLGLVALAFSMVGGLVLAEIMNLSLKEKITPLIGTAGVSAVPMAARVSQVMARTEDKHNFILMHAMGPNVAGVIGMAVAVGLTTSVLK